MFYSKTFLSMTKPKFKYLNILLGRMGLVLLKKTFKKLKGMLTSRDIWTKSWGFIQFFIGPQNEITTCYLNILGIKHRTGSPKYFSKRAQSIPLTRKINLPQNFNLIL